MKVIRLHHVGIAVSDMSRAKAIFHEALGLPIVQERVTADGRAVAIFRSAEVEFEVYEPKLSAAGGQSESHSPTGVIDHVGVEVDDLDEAMSRLASAGIESGPRQDGRTGASARTKPESSCGITLQLIQAQVSDA
jgi:methylmalonyl-CoA/ethylmalonyl-CoA epimerase